MLPQICVYAAEMSLASFVLPYICGRWSSDLGHCCIAMASLVMSALYLLLAIFTQTKCSGLKVFPIFPIFLVGSYISYIFIILDIFSYIFLYFFALCCKIYFFQYETFQDVCLPAVRVVAVQFTSALVKYATDELVK